MPAQSSVWLGPLIVVATVLAIEVPFQSFLTERETVRLDKACFVIQSEQIAMKSLLRIAAALSFAFCFLAGLVLLGNAVGSGYRDAFMVAAIGLVFIGIAFFVGAMLLVAAERLGRKAGGG